MAEQMQQKLAQHGLAAVFPPADTRGETVRGLWPGPSLLASPQQLGRQLRSILVADNYGGVETVRRAREAYNCRHPDLFHSHVAYDRFFWHLFGLSFGTVGIDYSLFFLPEAPHALRPGRSGL